MLAPYPGKNEPETMFFSLTEVSTREVATVIFYNTIMARLLSYTCCHKKLHRKLWNTASLEKNGRKKLCLHLKSSGDKLA